MASENRIGIGLMSQEAIELALGARTCEMCRWLERAYQTADTIPDIESYASEILLHRRSFHISSADNVN